MLCFRLHTLAQSHPPENSIETLKSMSYNGAKESVGRDRMHRKVFGCFQPIPLHRVMGVAALNASYPSPPPIGVEKGFRPPLPPNRGWANYFCLGPVSPAYNAINTHVTQRLRRCLCKKHKVRGTGWSRYPDQYLHEELGLIKPQLSVGERMTSCPRAGCGKSACPVR